MVTKLQLREKILVKLGKGVIRPNLTDLQVDASIEEAVQFFFDRVGDAVEHKYFKYQITQTDINRGDNAITLPNEIYDIAKLLPVRRRASFSIDEAGSITNQSSVFAYNYLSTAQNSGISDVYIAKQYMEMFKSMFSSSDGFTYSKFSNRVQLDLEIGIDVTVDDFLVFDARVLVDPESFNRFYGDRLLFNLATAYARQYEVTNLTKLSGIDIPGGVKFDVGRLEKRADDAITKFEMDIENYYRPSLGIYVS